MNKDNPQQKLPFFLKGMILFFLMCLSFQSALSYSADVDNLLITEKHLYHFKYKTAQDGLGSNLVNDILADGQLIYASTKGGLSISENGGETFKTVSGNGLAKGEVRTIFKDSNGVIYAGTANGLSISKDGGKHFVTKTERDGLSGNAVASVYVDHHQIIYVGTNGGLSISRDGGETFVRKKLDIECLPLIQAIFVDKNSTIYVGSLFDGGLFISRDGGNTFIKRTIENGLGSNMIFDIKKDSKNNLYVATDEGLSISKNDGKAFINKMYGDGSGLGGNSIKKIYIDSDDKIYVATTLGISISNDEGNTFITENDGLEYYSPRTVHPVHKGLIIYTATTRGLGIGTHTVPQ